MPPPMGGHHCRSVALCRCAGRAWGALRSAVHQPLETRSEATVLQPALQHVVKQEHQRDHRHRQHDGQKGEGHGTSLTSSLRQLARSTPIWLPSCNPLVTYGIPTNIRYCEHAAVVLSLFTQRRGREILGSSHSPGPMQEFLCREPRVRSPTY